MPHAIGALSDGKDDSMTPQVVNKGKGSVLVSGKPRLALVQPSAQHSGVVIQDDVFTIDAAGQASPRDLHIGGRVTRYSRVGDCNSP